MATREDLAYAAGIIDGEGCILIAKRRTPEHHELHVRVNTIDDTIAPWMHKTFGGNFCTSTNKDGRTLHIWSTSSAAAENFLRMVAPWLKLKKSQAELAFAFRETFKESFRGKTLPPALREQRARFYGQMKLLKEGCLLGNTH